jgi:LPS export ABC transporter protein LptC
MRSGLPLLPLLIVALACSEEPAPPVTVAADTADMIYYGVVHHLTMDGIRRATVEADSAYFYEGPQRIEMMHMRVTFFSPEGVETSRLTSDEGTYRWRTGDMEARGNVVAVTPDQRRLETSILEYFRNANEIRGPESFVFTTADQRLEGRAFRSDPDFRNVVTTQPRGDLGRVNVN